MEARQRASNPSWGANRKAVPNSANAAHEVAAVVLASMASVANLPVKAAPNDTATVKSK